VIRAIVGLGGTYPDVVQALQQAKADGALVSRFEVDALPQAGRSYDRVAAKSKSDGDVGSDEGADQTPSIEVATPLPDLFARPR
jgi:hypothetical protein